MPEHLRGCERWAFRWSQPGSELRETKILSRVLVQHYESFDEKIAKVERAAIVKRHPLMTGRKKSIHAEVNVAHEFEVVREVPGG